MKTKSLILIAFFCIGLILSYAVNSAAAVSAVYGGGPFYSGGQAVMDDLRNSGFNTVMLWSIHVATNGDLSYNDIKIISNGSYIGDSGWQGRLATLKQAPTSVNRIEVSIGAWGCADFESIKSLVASQGTGSGSILYKNFQKLKSITGADAVNFDDESCYDVSSSVAFGQMCSVLGYKVSLCPYTNSSYWVGVKNQLGSIVDRCYLQCYSGGASNDPGSWQNTMGMKVIPGLWCNDYTPSGVQSKMTSWNNSYGIAGGFMWLYDNFAAGQAKQYASAINNAFGAVNPTPTPGAGAIFYQDVNYVGTATRAIPPGNYTLSQLQSYGFVNDWASSCKTSGYTVIMYADDNFSGTSWTLMGDTANFVNLSPNANDIVTSVKIQTGGSSTPTATKTPTVSKTPSGAATPTATKTPTPSGGGSAWQPNTYYAVGATVTYGGHTYRCLQAHTSLVGWEPPNVPALWQLIS